jgi:antitoxin ParD1/3/4
MAVTRKVTVSLTPEMAGFVRGVVEAGEYASTGEAIRAAVREWKERRDLLGYTIEELRDLAQEGIDSGPSPYATMDEVRAEARRRLEADRKA